MDRSKPDRAETIAAFVRICRNADRIELLRAILLRWPDITLDELWWGMKLAVSDPQGSTVHPSASKADALSVELRGLGASSNMLRDVRSSHMEAPPELSWGGALHRMGRGCPNASTERRSHWH